MDGAWIISGPLVDHKWGNTARTAPTRPRSAAGRGGSPLREHVAQCVCCSSRTMPCCWHEIPHNAEASAIGKPGKVATPPGSSELVQRFRSWLACRVLKLLPRWSHEAPSCASLDSSRATETLRLMRKVLLLPFLLLLVGCEPPERSRGFIRSTCPQCSEVKEQEACKSCGTKNDFVEVESQPGSFECLKCTASLHQLFCSSCGASIEGRLLKFSTGK